MSEIKQRLFDAFRADHAVLGKGLYELAARLRASDVAGARQAADNIDNKNGAHIAFEQSDFYPALAPFLSAPEIDSMYIDHTEGQQMLKQVQSMSEGELQDKQRQQQLIEAVEHMETHVSECGELFGAMGGLDDAEQQHLLERIEYWRKQAPLWTSLAVERRPNQ